MPATTKPPPTLAKELAALDRMTTAELRDKFAAVVGEPTAAGNRAWLIRRVGWRIQALTEGDLSDRAKARAAELARDADLRLSSPADRSTLTAAPAQPAAPVAALDPRLPAVGAVLTRTYKGAVVRVKVQPDGLEYDGELCRSLSAVAKAVTGSHGNGYRFFRLTGGGRVTTTNPSRRATVTRVRCTRGRCSRGGRSSVTSCTRRTRGHRSGRSRRTPGTAPGRSTGTAGTSRPGS